MNAFGVSDRQRGLPLPNLTINEAGQRTKIHNMVSADGAIVDDDV